MSQRLFVGVLSIACATLLGSSCWAATVEPVQGNLSINQGQGFQPINSRIDANVGDTLMVAPGGSAVVVYADGCKVNVQPGAVTTIAPLSPCASGSYADDTYNNPVWGYVLGAGALAALGVGAYEATQTSHAATPVPMPIPASP